jgi:type IV secretory pathway protease TraF
MRNSPHDLHIRRYTIGEDGVTIGGEVHGYRGVLTGLPVLTTAAQSGLTGPEMTLLQQIRDLGETTVTELSRRSGIKGSALTAALERIRQLGYAVRKQRKGIVMYLEKKQ